MVFESKILNPVELKEEIRSFNIVCDRSVVAEEAILIVTEYTVYIYYGCHPITLCQVELQSFANCLLSAKPSSIVLTCDQPQAVVSAFRILSL